MQSIKFKGGFVQTLNPEVRRLATQVGYLQHGVARVKGSLDGRISTRSGISANLTKAGSSLGRIEQKLNELSSFVNQSVNSYTSAENNVNKRAVSLVSSWNKGFGLSAGNNSGAKAIDKAVTKAEKEKIHL